MKKSLALTVCLISVTACSTRLLGPTSEFKQDSGLNAVPDLLMTRLPSENQTIRGGRDFNDKAAKQQVKGEVFRKASQPWIGAKAIPVREGERLPDAFYEKIVFNNADTDASWTLDVLASRLSRMTKMPVRISPDCYTAFKERKDIQDTPDAATEVDEILPENDVALPEVDADKEAAKQKALPKMGAKNNENGTQKIMFSPALLKWNGSLKGFLTHIADRLDLNWTYQDDGIYISRYLVESFEVAQFPFDSAYKFTSGAAAGAAGKSGAAGSKGGSTQATPTLEMKFNEQGNLEYFNSTLKILKGMIASAPGSELYVSDATGKVVVKSSRVVLSQIRDFLRTENTSMLRQVVIQVDIYSVTTNDSSQFAVNWSSAYQKMFSSVVAQKSVIDAGDVSMATFQLTKGSSIPATVVIDSLRSQGFSVQHRPVSMIAMNRQWAKKSRLAVTNYLAETTPAQGGGLGGATGGVGVPGLKQASLVVGDQLAMMPFILENNTVLLKFGFSLSDLVSLDKVETGSDQTKQVIQTPVTTSVSDQFTVAIKPGELMAITGLSKNNTGGKRNTLGESIPLLFGGSEKNSSDKEQLLLLMRVVLL